MGKPIRIIEEAAAGAVSTGAAATYEAPGTARAMASLRQRTASNSKPPRTSAAPAARKKTSDTKNTCASFTVAQIELQKRSVVK